MQYTKLNNNMRISKVALGTSLWGSPIKQQDAFSQIELSQDLGVTLWDTAEVYPVPLKRETYGVTESIIGNYFQDNPSKKDDILIATKMATRDFSSWIRDGLGKTPANMIDAVNGSLKRMNINALGIFQIHYPLRNVHVENLSTDTLKQDIDCMVTIIETCNQLIKTGKIRSYGFCNETAWGLTKFCSLAEVLHLEKPAMIQNEYSLLARSIDTDLAEACMREQVLNLAYAPLAGGLLTGKHLAGIVPGSRFDTWSKHKENKYLSEKGIGNSLIADYVQLAHDINITPAELSLAWVMQQKFICSTIVAGTKLQHLKSNINTINIKFSTETLNQMETIRNRYK